MRIEFNTEEIYNQKRLKELADKLGLRDDWHEPDEEGISVMILGTVFDNAGTGSEIRVVVMKNGKPEFAISLATLFALATGYNGEK